MKDDLGKIRVRKEAAKIKHRTILLWASVVILGMILATGCFMAVMQTIGRSKLSENQFFAVLPVVLTSLFGFLKLVFKYVFSGNGKRSQGQGSRTQGSSTQGGQR